MRNLPVALRTRIQRPRSAVSASWKRASTRRTGSAAAATNASYAGAAYHHSSAPASAPAANLSASRHMHARRPDVEERDGRAADDGLPDREVEELEDDRLDAVAAVLDRDSVRARGEDHAADRDVLAEEVEDRGGGDGDGAAERHDHRAVDRLQRQRQIEHREQHEKTDEEAGRLHRAPSSTGKWNDW